MTRIDTHQHLAFKDKFSYPWMNDEPPLDEDRFYPSDYWEAAEGCSIGGTIFMENDVAEESGMAEAAHVCRLAGDSSNRILGVIASARPEREGFAAYLDRIQHERLVGVRRILHVQPDQLSKSVLFRDNLRQLATRDLTFDLCVLQRQLEVGLELVRSCPDTRFILDHCGVPAISDNDAPNGDGWKDWLEKVRRIAECSNAHCKISGIIVYASAEQRTVEGLRPYVEAVIEAFGWERVVWGGDWPVCTLGGSLAGWCGIIDGILSGESGDNRAKLFHRNASRIYGVPEPG